MQFKSRALRLFAFVVPTFALLLAPAFDAATAAAKKRPAVASVLAPNDARTPWLYRGSDIPQDPEWIFGELPNGLRYAVRKNGVPPGQVSIRVRVDAGSLNENDDERGFAHFIEHLVFRQSKYLADGEAIHTWQRLGATFGSDTNAETTPTGTTYKIDLPNADLDNAKLEIKSAAFDGKVYGADQIDVLARLPNRESALTMLASVLQAPISKFGRLFTALKEKQEQAA